MYKYVYIYAQASIIFVAKLLWSHLVHTVDGERFTGLNFHCFRGF